MIRAGQTSFPHFHRRGPHPPGEVEQIGDAAIFQDREGPVEGLGDKPSPNTASDSHTASPIHMAARNGSTLLAPRLTTRATSAAMLGPGEPAATSSAPRRWLVPRVP